MRRVIPSSYQGLHLGRIFLGGQHQITHLKNVLAILGQSRRNGGSRTFCTLSLSPVREARECAKWRDCGIISRPLRSTQTFLAGTCAAALSLPIEASRIVGLAWELAAHFRIYLLWEVPWGWLFRPWTSQSFRALAWRQTWLQLVKFSEKNMVYKRSKIRRNNDGKGSGEQQDESTSEWRRSSLIYIGLTLPWKRSLTGRMIHTWQIVCKIERLWRKRAMDKGELREPREARGVDGLQMRRHTGTSTLEKWTWVRETLGILISTTSYSITRIRMWPNYKSDSSGNWLGLVGSVKISERFEERNLLKQRRVTTWSNLCV